MRASTIFGILLVLILAFTFGPALVAVGSEFVAEGFGCKTNLNYAVPCVIGGKDYGETFYNLGFLIWYSYITLPVGAVLAAIWAVAAFITFLRVRAKGGSAAVAAEATTRPGRAFLRGAAIAIALALSPIAITYLGGYGAKALGCDLNELAEHPCTLLGLNVGPLLSTMANTIWFISLTVMAGLVALIMLFAFYIVRVVRGRRTKMDGTAAKA